MATRLYTAIGKFKIKHAEKGLRYPYIENCRKEYILDLQEMILWTTLNWRILSADEITPFYEHKIEEAKLTPQRSMYECMNRLVQRGLIAEGIGNTKADALYDMISELYVIPISENLLLKAICFIRLICCYKMPYTEAKKVFRKEKQDTEAEKIICLAKQATLSTAEIIKCISQNTIHFANEAELIDLLYHDEYTTSDNIAYAVQALPQCFSVAKTIANLYLQKQIIFERN
jgi:hypothetical protein